MRSEYFVGVEGRSFQFYVLLCICDCKMNYPILCEYKLSLNQKSVDLTLLWPIKRITAVMYLGLQKVRHLLHDSWSISLS
jgi:hypothetical protein